MLSRYLLVTILICSVGLVQATSQEAPQQQQATAVETNEPSRPNEKSPPVKPKINFEKLVHDFGELGINQKGECEFRFKNIGSGPLNISEVKSTCGCTVPTLAKTQYQPGEEGVIKIDYSGQNNPGSIEKNIYVNTNDPENPQIKLTITAKITSYIEALPSEMRLLMWKEKAAAPDITLKSKNGEAFAITSITSPYNIISIEFDPNTQNSEFILKSKVDTQKLKEHPSGSIQIELTHPKQHSVGIPYEVIPPFEAQPKRLLLTKLEPGESQTAQILITSSDNEPFEVNSISSKKGFVEVISQQHRSKGIELTVQVTAPPKKDDRSMYFSDELEIKTNSGEIITVPCNGLYHRPTDKK
jgi:hypothetical protein